MGYCLLIAGILLNSALILFNRLVKRLPNRLQFPLLLVAVGLMLTGFSMMNP